MENPRFLRKNVFLDDVINGLVSLLAMPPQHLFLDGLRQTFQLHDDRCIENTNNEAKECLRCTKHSVFEVKL